MRKEFLVGAITTGPRTEISLFELLKAREWKGRLKSIEIASDRAINNFLLPPLTPEVLSTIIKIGFDKTVRKEDIHLSNLSNSKIEETDRGFARKLGFKIVSLAFATLNKQQGVEAWICPTLVKAESFIADKEGLEGVSPTVELETLPSYDGAKLYENRTVSYDETVCGHYVRLTVKDDPGALSKVAGEFGIRGISIKGMLQPDSQNGGKQKEMAFLLWPCKTGDLNFAVSSIGELDVVLQTNAVFRALL